MIAVSFMGRSMANEWDFSFGKESDDTHPVKMIHRHHDRRRQRYSEEREREIGYGFDRGI